MLLLAIVSFEAAALYTAFDLSQGIVGRDGQVTHGVPITGIPEHTFNVDVTSFPCK